jgi:uncharacterized protein
VNGATMPATPDANGFVRVERNWKPNNKIELQFPMIPRVNTGRDANAGGAPFGCVSLGPLLFVLPIADMKDANTADPAAKWQFALDAEEDQPASGVTVERSAMPGKWDWPLASPLKLRASAVSFDWKPTLEKPLPAEAIEEKKPPETITLVPYGCTKFRVSMFPVTRKTFKPEKPAGR